VLNLYIEIFRLRALISGFAVGILALIVFLLAGTGAPTVRAGISRSWWALGLHLFTAVFAIGAGLLGAHVVGLLKKNACQKKRYLKPPEEFSHPNLHCIAIEPLTSALRFSFRFDYVELLCLEHRGG